MITLEDQIKDIEYLKKELEAVDFVSTLHVHSLAFYSGDIELFKAILESLNRLKDLEK